MHRCPDGGQGPPEREALRPSSTRRRRAMARRVPGPIGPPPAPRRSRCPRRRGLRCRRDRGLGPGRRVAAARRAGFGFQHGHVGAGGMARGPPFRRGGSVSQGPPPRPPVRPGPGDFPARGTASAAERQRCASTCEAGTLRGFAPGEPRTDASTALESTSAAASGREVEPHGGLAAPHSPGRPWGRMVTPPAVPTLRTVPRTPCGSRRSRRRIASAGTGPAPPPG